MSQRHGNTAAQPPQRTIDLIVVHCAATPSGKPLASGLGDRRRTAAQVIDHWHMQRGFARAAAAVAEHNPHLPHIGYHYVIDLDGLLLTGRALAEQGAHVKGYNDSSIGICLVGGLEPVGRYSLAQWRTLKKLCATLTGAYPFASVVGHRTLAPGRTCPGFDAPAWWGAGGEPPAGHVFSLASGQVH